MKMKEQGMAAQQAQMEGRPRKWVSIDPAYSGPTGYCEWHGDKPKAWGVVKPCGNKGAWWVGGCKMESEVAAFDCVIAGNAEVVVEVGRGSFRNADIPLGKRLGYIKALCDFGGKAYNEIALSEWRRILREQTGYSWPTGTDAKKALARQIVMQAYEIECGADEADAICVGMAWIASGRA
jgi:hypothetical protein